MTTETLPRGEFTPRLGLKRPRRGSIELKLPDFLDPDLPATPASFGHHELIPDNAWLMLGNDQYGDCAWATEAHATMLRTVESTGTAAAFDEVCVLSDYSRATGFTPTDPSTDRGTDLDEQAQYLRKVGIIDAAGKRHLIGAYAEPDLNPDGLARAAHLFQVVNVGIRITQSAQDQFAAGQVWDVGGDSTPLGGHSIALVGKQDDRFAFVTWGHLQWATTAFVKEYVDQAYVGFSTDLLKGDKSIDGFDTAALQRYIEAIG